MTWKPYCKHESKKRLLTSTEWLPPSLAEDSEQQAAAYKNERMSRDQLPLTFNITFKTKIRGDFESMTLKIIGFWASRGFYQNEMYLVWGTTAKLYAAFLLCIPPAHQGRLAGDRKPSDSTIHCYLDCWKKESCHNHRMYFKWEWSLGSQLSTQNSLLRKPISFYLWSHNKFSFQFFQVRERTY